MFLDGLINLKEWRKKDDQQASKNVNGFIFGIFDRGGKNYELLRFFGNSYKEIEKKREETKTTLETIVPHT